MAEYFGPFWPDGYFGSGYWGDAGSDGGPIYLDAAAVLSGGGLIVRAEPENGQPEVEPARPVVSGGGGGRRRSRGIRRTFAPAPRYIDAGAVLVAGASLTGKAASTVSGGAVLTGRSAVIAAPETVATYAADNAFWLLAA